MNEQNMALLSQSEIDTLIEFLNREREKTVVDSQVLNQESIDKLIRLIHNHREFVDNIGVSVPGQEEGRLRSFYDLYKLDYTKSDGYELQMSLNEKNQAELYLETGKGIRLPIVPEQLDDPLFQGTSAGWGVCVMPVVFAQTARTFEISYSAEMMEQVCRRYALMMYGKEDAPIPKPFLAEGEK